MRRGRHGREGRRRCSCRVAVATGSRSGRGSFCCRLCRCLADWHIYLRLRLRLDLRRRHHGRRLERLRRRCCLLGRSAAFSRLERRLERLLARSAAALSRALGRHKQPKRGERHVACSDPTPSGSRLVHRLALDALPRAGRDGGGGGCSSGHGELRGRRRASGACGDGRRGCWRRGHDNSSRAHLLEWPHHRRGHASLLVAVVVFDVVGAVRMHLQSEAIGGTQRQSTE